MFRVLTYRRILCGLPVVILAFVVSTASSQNIATPREQFHVESGELWIVPGKVFGADQQFILDTGAAVCVFDSRFKGMLKEKGTTEARTPSGTVKLSTFQQPPMSLGRITVPANDISIVIDMSPIRKAIGKKVDGIVGLSALKQQVVRCKIDQKRVEFWDSIPEDSGSEIPAKWQKQGGFEIELMCSGSHREKCLVDSGNVAELTLRADLFDFLQFVGSISRVREVEFGTAEKIVRVKEGVLNQTVLGNWQHKELVVNRGTSFSIIGLKYLNRYMVTFDFPGRRLFLKPSKYFSEKSRRTCLGVGLYDRKGKVALKYVIADSPAAKADLKADDIIEAVNGKNVTCSSLYSLRRLFENEGETVSLSVRRGDRTAAVKIQLVDF